MFCPQSRSSKSWKGPRLTLEALEDRTLLAPLIGLGTSNELVAFDSTDPGRLTRRVAITGLLGGASERVLAIDFRPADGRLYGVSSGSRLYALNPVTGAATAVGSAGAFTLVGDFTQPFSSFSTRVDVDFDPVADVLRVVSSASQNLRLNPNDGTLVAADAAPAYAAGDPGAGTAPTVRGIAYTNSFAGAPAAQLFGIDAARGVLVQVLPADAGTLRTVGPTGGFSNSLVAFDVRRTDVNTAFAVINVTGRFPGTDGGSVLSTVDLTTGWVTPGGAVGRIVADRSYEVVLIGLAAPLPRGLSTPGAFDPATATWFLRNANSAGPADRAFQYGGANWLPVVGDWDGDGRDTVGAVDPTGSASASDLVWYLRNSNSAGAADVAPFRFGSRGWVPVVGDWDGNGTVTVGAFDPATATWYLRNTNSAGAADLVFQYGGINWIPVVGDWDGDGRDTVGAVDPTGQNLSANDLVWYLRNSNSAGAADVAPFRFGSRGWVPVVGDWDNDGVDTVGAVDPTGGINPADLVWLLRNRNSAGTPDIAPFAYGPRQAVRPLAGDWNYPNPGPFR